MATSERCSSKRSRDKSRSGVEDFVTARQLTEHLRDEMIRHTEHKNVKQRPDGGYLDLVGFREGDFVFELRRADGSRVEAQMDAPAVALSAQEQLRQQEELSARLSLLLKNRNPPAKPFTIDTLARRYEGQESGHTGIDAAGNRYYGVYRLQAGSNLDEFLTFLRRFHPHFAEPLSRAGGSRAAKRAAPAFIAAWKSLGEVPEFNAAQVKFIIAVDYRRLIEQMKAAKDPDDPDRRTLAFDVSTRSLALQAVLFSIANQLGPSTTLPFDALEPLGDVTSLSDERIIDALLDRRDLVSFYSPEITNDKFIELYKQRNDMEKQDALFMLKN